MEKMEDPNYIFLNSKIFSFLKPKLLKKAGLGRRIIHWNVLFPKQTRKGKYRLSIPWRNMYLLNCSSANEANEDGPALLVGNYFACACMCLCSMTITTQCKIIVHANFTIIPLCFQQHLTSVPGQGRQTKAACLSQSQSAKILLALLVYSVLQIKVPAGLHYQTLKALYLKYYLYVKMTSSKYKH